MNKNHKILLAAGALLYVIYHLATLIYSPIPWFDEVIFANITDAFIKNGNFYEEARTVSWHAHQVDMAYGPVYFLLQRAIISVSGFTIFTFRIAALLAGLINIFLLYKVCETLNIKKWVAILICLLTCLDPQYNQFLHSGRMDLVGVCFFLCSYLIFCRIGKERPRQHLWLALPIGLLMGCAFLSNPRLVFTFFFYVFFGCYELWRYRKELMPVLLKYVLMFAGVFSLFYIWVYTQFGTLQNYIYQNYTHSPIVQEHVGSGAAHIRITYNLIMFGIAFISLLLLAINRQVGKNMRLLLFTVPAIIVFLLLVNGGISGRYYGTIVPFVTLLYAGATVNVYDGKLWRVGTYAILVFFAGAFLFKGIYVLSTLDKRDPRYFEREVAKVVPRHSSVVADFQYFYILKKNECSYQCLEENGTFKEKTAYFLNKKYDYFIINQQNANKEQYEKAFLDGRYQLVATIERPDNSALSGIIRKLPVKINESYSCYIYKYIGG